MAAPPFHIDRLRTVSQRPQFYHGWPTLAQRRNGELILVCSGGRDAHVCPFGWVEMQRSRDQGQNWSYPAVTLDLPVDVRDAGVVETAQGSLLVTTFTSFGYEKWLRDAERRGPARAGPGAVHDPLDRWRHHMVVTLPVSGR